MTNSYARHELNWLIKAWIDSEPYPATLIAPPTTVFLMTAKREEMGLYAEKEDAGEDMGPV